VLVVETDDETEQQQETHQFCIVHYPLLANISADSQTATRWPLAIIKVNLI
jgi:hypothetical protein